MAILNIEPELVSVVSVLERGVFVASFASFFWGILVRLYDTSWRRRK
jgi:hypothetical protein